MAESSAKPSPDVTGQLARVREALRNSQPAMARRMLARLLTAQPDNSQARRLMGVAAQACGDHATAVDCFRRVLPIWPDDPTLHIRLGITLYLHGTTEEAVVTLRRACKLAPQSASAWYNLGEALKTDSQRSTETLDAFARSVHLEPGHTRARLSLARTKASVGDAAGAALEFRDVLGRDPDNAWAWFGLSDLNVVKFSAADVQHLRQAYAHSQQKSEARNLLGFALAKALEHQGDYAQAFDVFQIANASWRRHVKWDAATEHALISVTQDTFANWTPSQPVDPNLGRGVIFIASLPRSGSSLVEHMLASHPRVEGANEIKDMPQVLRTETQRRRQAFPFWISSASADDWHRLGKEYLARTARWRKHKPCFTDKNLLNWQWVGAVLAMLPAARVVIVRRDPVETCLACFRQRFARDVGFTYNLDELADRCADFVQLTRFWLHKYPDRVFDLEYEHLVAEPETTLRQLLNFCALPFNPACLMPHRTKRTIMSAPSAAQVYEPLRQDTARAARYGAKLDPLRQRLHEAGVI